MKPGDRIGSFVIERFLAEGGLGQVYVAEHTELKRKVAFKVLKAEASADPAAIQRFFQEARVVSRLGHPHLIDIFDLGHAPDGRVYYVMELLEGRTLAQRMAQQPLRFSELLPIMLDVCSALEAAHAAKIIHRDLKPDNLFLVERPGEPPFVKILDFGIAKVIGLEAAIEANLTRTGNLIGTPQYMAPEQIEGLPIDARTDLYALGVILYQLATRALPFRGQTLGAMLKAHLLESPPRFPPTVAALGVPATFEAVVRRALAKDPNDRYPDVAALRDDLLRLSRGEVPAAQAWWQAQPDGAPRSSQKLDPAAPTMAFRAADVLAPRAAVDPIDQMDTQPVPKAPAVTAPRASGKRVIALFLTLVGVTIASAFTIFTLRKNHPKTKAALAAGPSIAALRSQALSAITAALGDGDPAVRKQAIELLAGTHDARHAGLVEPKLKDADVTVRATAAAALGQLGARDSTAALRTAETGRDNVAAHEALMLLGAPEGEAKLRQLVASPDEGVRGAAALALGARDPRALAELERQIATPTVEEAQRLRALGRLCASAVRWKDELVKLIDQSPPPLQVRALEPLATCDAELARARLRPLAAPTAPTRPAALRLLARLDDHAGFDTALARLAQPTTPLDERVTSAEVIGLSGEKAALPKLAPLLADADPQLRTAIAGAVLTILSRDPHALASRSLSWAASALGHQSPALREQAALVLGDANAQLAIPLLGRAMRDPQPEVRRAAASSLGRTKSSAAAGLLDTALSDDKADVRLTAIRSLGKLPQEASSPVLRRHVQRSAAGERVLTAGQLVRFGDQEAVGTVRAALREADPEVRRAALEVADAAPELAVEASRAGLADKDPEVRLAAALLAAQQKNADALPVLREWLPRGGTNALRAYAAIHTLGSAPPATFDPAGTVEGPIDARRSAMQIAQRLPLAKALLVWRRGLGDAEATVRMAALEAIGDAASDDAGALIFVRGALADADAGVRAKAGAILGRLAPPLAQGEEPVEPPPVLPVDDLGAPPPADLAPAVDAAAAPVADLAPAAVEKPSEPDPKEDARLAMTAGEVALRTGKIESAITELERARKLNAKLPLYFSLGEAYRKRGDHETDPGKQRQAYERAIEHYKKSKDKRGAAYAAELVERLGEK